MNKLDYGERVNGYSTCLQAQFAEFQLHRGGANGYRDNRLVCSFVIHGIGVQVFDQDACAKIYDLTGIGKDKAAVEPYLNELLFKALAAKPEYLQWRLDVEYQRGVEDGRLAKINEIRSALEIE